MLFRLANQVVKSYNLNAFTYSLKSVCNLRNFPAMATSASSNFHEVDKLMKEVAAGGSSLVIEKKTRALCKIYMEMKNEEKNLFVKHVALNHGVDQSNLISVMQTICSNQDKGNLFFLKAIEKLRSSVTARYNNFFTQVGRIEGGVKFLVDLRTAVLNLLSLPDTDEIYQSQLRLVNSNLRELLSLWFSVGLMQLERITWDSSCEMLQKISEYEAVHPVRNWTDLKRRVGPYRRCYVFTHTSMPGEPIVVLHTALTAEISSSIMSIVSLQRMHSVGDIFRPVANSQVEDPKKIQAAIFYSITSTQRGLQGIELGTQLIKRVVGEVTKEFPRMVQFSTLSPIPGFREWILGEIHKTEKGEIPGSSLLASDEFDSLKEHVCKGEHADTSPWIRLGRLLSNNSWIQDATLTDLLKKPLLKICAQYLYQVKRRNYAFNSVAHFHLRNGAVLWRLNWNADLSPRGLSNSCGMMVNYRYYLENLEANSERYNEEFHVEASEQFLRLLGGSPQSTL